MSSPQCFFLIYSLNFFIQFHLLQGHLRAVFLIISLLQLFFIKIIIKPPAYCFSVIFFSILRACLKNKLTTIDCV